MGGSIVFVHGTGVRRAGFDRLFARFSARAKRNGLDKASLVPCCWGSLLGAPVIDVPVSLPVETVPGATVADRANSAGAWAVLIDDPLFELRVAAQSAPTSPTIQPGRLRPDEEAVQMLAKLNGFGSTAEQLSLLSRCEVSAQEVAQAAELVGEAKELRSAAIAAGSAVDPDLVEAIARAVAAEMLAAHRRDLPGLVPAVAFDAGLRGELVSEISRSLAPAVKGLSGWLKHRFVELASRAVTESVEGRRAQIMSSASPAIADILYYQRRGDDVRRFVAKTLTNLERPVVAVGHSLGGVILVDLLSQQDAPTVDLLVTAGSQAPYFYAIDALGDLRPGNRVTPFTPWLNVYNPDDFLSFYASREFDGVLGITDVMVDPGVPFPEAHSAYWEHDPVYAAIRAHWPTAWGADT
jgi:hypothetical protein